MRFQRLWYWPLVASLMLAACSLGEDITPPPNNTPLSAATSPAVVSDGAAGTPSIADGAAIFAQHCAPCHGASGKGDGPMAPQLLSQRGAPLPDFSSPAWLKAHNPTDLFQVITDGRLDKLMPPWKAQLSETQRWAVVAFLSTLSVTGSGNVASGAPAATPPATPLPAASAPASNASTALASTGQQMGEAAGQVINGTQGAAAFANQTIVLRGYDNFNLAETMTTTTGADGIFDFQQVPTIAGRQFLASTRYAGLDYSSDLINFDAQTRVTGVRMTVYEVTADPSVLQVEQMHITIGPNVSAGQVDVSEMLLFSNTSDKIYAPGTGPALAVPLPSGAAALTLPNQNQGLDLTQVAQTVVRNTPLQPGLNTATVSFSLRLPYNNRLDFEQKLAYPVKSLNVFVPATHVAVQGAPFQDQGTQDAQTSTLHVYAAQSLPANDTVTFQVTGLAGAGGLGSLPAIGTAPLGWLIGLMAVGLVLAGGGLGWRYWRSRLTNRAQTYDDLIQAIADLDDAFEAGRLPEQRYRLQRDRLKRKLVAWMESRQEAEREMDEVGRELK